MKTGGVPAAGRLPRLEALLVVAVEAAQGALELLGELRLDLGFVGGTTFP